MVDGLVRFVIREREDARGIDEPTPASMPPLERGRSSISVLSNVNEERGEGSSECTSPNVGSPPAFPSGQQSPDPSVLTPPPFPADMLRSRRQSQVIKLSLAVLSATEEVAVSGKEEASDSAPTAASAEDYQLAYSFLQGRAPKLPSAAELMRLLGRPLAREDLVDLVIVVSHAYF